MAVLCFGSTISHFVAFVQPLNSSLNSHEHQMFCRFSSSRSLQSSSLQINHSPSKRFEICRSTSCTYESNPISNQAESTSAAAEFSISSEDVRSSVEDLEECGCPVSKQEQWDSSRRTLSAVFTCNLCGTRSKRQINPHAYKRGTVYVQCAGCDVYHKLVDNLGLVVEYDFRMKDNATLVPDADSRSSEVLD